MAIHSRPAGAMHNAHIAWAQCVSLSIGGSGILNLVAHMPGETILRADDTWFVVMIILLGVGALTLHRYDVQRALIRIVFGWFVLGALLLGYGGEHL